MTIEYLTWQKDWMATFTGHAVYPLHLKPEDIKLADIAHSLSQQARYNGHSKFPYWVGQHCVLIARALKRDGYPIDVQRVGLMHDASEAYTGDITKPMKNSLNTKIRELGYSGKFLKDIEHDIERRIALKFGLAWPWCDTVEEYDTRITQDEKAQIFVEQDAVWTIPMPPLDVKIEEWTWRWAEHEFLQCAWELGLDN